MAENTNTNRSSTSGFMDNIYKYWNNLGDYQYLALALAVVAVIVILVIALSIRNNRLRAQQLKEETEQEQRDKRNLQDLEAQQAQILRYAAYIFISYLFVGLMVVRLMETTKLSNKISGASLQNGENSAYLQATDKLASSARVDKIKTTANIEIFAHSATGTKAQKANKAEEGAEAQAKVVYNQYVADVKADHDHTLKDLDMTAPTSKETQYLDILAKNQNAIAADKTINPSDKGSAAETPEAVNDYKHLKSILTVEPTPAQTHALESRMRSIYSQQAHKLAKDKSVQLGSFELLQDQGLYSTPPTSIHGIINWIFGVIFSPSVLLNYIIYHIDEEVLAQFQATTIDVSN